MDAVFLYNYGSLMGNFTQVLWQSTFVIYIPSKKFEEAVYKINTDLESRYRLLSGIADNYYYKSEQARQLVRLA